MAFIVKTDSLSFDILWVVCSNELIPCISKFVFNRILKYKYVSGKHITSNLSSELRVLRSEIFGKLCAGMLFMFQGHTDKFRPELSFDPGFNSTSPLKMTCISQIHK